MPNGTDTYLAPKVPVPLSTSSRRVLPEVGKDILTGGYNQYKGRQFVNWRPYEGKGDSRDPRDVEFSREYIRDHYNDPIWIGQYLTGPELRNAYQQGRFKYDNYRPYQAEISRFLSKNPTANHEDVLKFVHNLKQSQQSQ